MLHVLRRARACRSATRCSSPTWSTRASGLLDEASAKGKTIHLPDDITGVDASGNFATFGNRLADGCKGFDIGPGSAAAFSDVIMDARMVFWNGPMGMFEDERFAAGTRTVAQAMADTKAFTVVGGGDSAAALAQFKLDDEVDHVSTGGGASLELLENGDLPGLQALRARPVMSRRILISGNWKMHHNHYEAIQTVQKLHYLVPKDAFENVDVCIHPPFTDLRSVQTVIESDDMAFALGAQHCHWEDKGAFTGEISPGFLAKLNVRYVVAGHSERRELFGETDEMVNKKVAAIQANGMIPIMCVGETLDEREAGDTESKVLGQLEAGLAGRTARADRRPRDRLRADLGDRHGQDRHGRGRPGGVRGDPSAVDRADRRRHRRRGPDPVRRIGQGRQRRRADGAARHRRRARRRSESRPRRVRPHHPIRRLSRHREGGTFVPASVSKSGLTFHTAEIRPAYRAVSGAASVRTPVIHQGGG